MKDDGRGHERAVAAAVEAIDVVSPTAYRWMGERSDVPEEVARHASPDGLRGALVQAIMWRLYGCFFATGWPVPAQAGARSGVQRGLSRALAAANCGTGCFELGWRVVGWDGDCVVAARGMLRLWARPDEVRTDDGARPAPGDPVAVRLPSDAPELSPGFYLALGNQGLSADAPRRLDRFYLNVREEGAVELVRTVTRRLNDDGLGFRLKVVDEPGAFERHDSAVLTLERCDRQRGLPSVLALHAQLEELLDPGTPALTRALAPGFAFAEDPGGSESFGIHRCGLIADAVAAASERGVQDLAGRMDVVRERLLAAGTSLERPYLGAHSAGDLRMPAVQPTSTERASWR